MLEESDGEEKNKNDDFHLSDTETDEPFYDNIIVSLSAKESELIKSLLPKRDLVQIRSQIARHQGQHKDFLNNEEIIKETEGRIDPSDKDYDKDDEEEEENEKEIINQNLKTAKAKSTENKNNVETRELLFLRKDNMMHFVDTDGKPLDSGS